MKVFILNCGSDAGGSSVFCGKVILKELQEKGISCAMDDLHRFSPLGREKLGKFIEESGAYAVVSTHVYAAFIMTKILRQNDSPLRHYFVTTDYACHRSYRCIHPDIWFIPDNSLAEEFVRCGVPKERLAVSGIPIQKESSRLEDKAAAKQKAGISYYTSHLMIVCDGIGDEKIKALLKKVGALSWKNFRISVICGINQSLCEKLKQVYAKDDRFHIKGTDFDFAKLMESADILMMKPEAILAAKAAQKKIPMIFMEAKTFREQSNQRYFIEKGVAVTAKSTKDLADLACRLLYYDKQLAKFEENYRSMPERNGAEMIVKRIMDDCARSGGD